FASIRIMPTSSRSDRPGHRMEMPEPPAGPQLPKPTVPRRGLAGLLTPRFSWSFERSLYRAYYALPGISDSRKRAFIEWLHRHAGWLTRNTLSFKVQAQ